MIAIVNQGERRWRSWIGHTWIARCSGEIDGHVENCARDGRLFEGGGIIRTGNRQSWGYFLYHHDHIPQDKEQLWKYAKTYRWKD